MDVLVTCMYVRKPEYGVRASGLESHMVVVSLHGAARGQTWAPLGETTHQTLNLFHFLSIFLIFEYSDK